MVTFVTVREAKSSTNKPEPPLVHSPKVSPKILVAIPAYNEEIAIGSVILRALKHADKVLVINDGSKDKTAEIARLAGAEILDHATNGGKGSAIKDAFTYARRNQTDILVLIDGDGQHNPDEIPSLLAPIINNQADIVNGSRFIQGNGHNVPGYRRMGLEILSLATNFGARLRITDTQSGFRAFSKATFNQFSFRQNGMAIESEMLVDAAEANFRIAEVPIDVRYDIAKTSTFNPVAHGLKVLGEVIGLISQRRPLLFFCVPGAALMVVGFAYIALNFLVFNVASDISIINTIGSAFIILAGIFCIFTGFILGAVQSSKMVKVGLN